MEKSHIEANSDQSYNKSNQESTQNNSDFTQKKLNKNNVEDAEEVSAETIFQRRPQFRFNENNRRRFF